MWMQADSWARVNVVVIVVAVVVGGGVDAG